MSSHTDPRSPSPGTAQVVIESIRDMTRMREVEHLQMDIWGSSPAWVVPTHVLYIVEASGGILLGAYVDGAPAGFVLGFLARAGDTLYHASHMLGIHPRYQGHGIGAALKWAQREQALAQGLDLMTWTFDPLEARNAHFNLHKLGAISRRYRENVYGELDDGLNRGLPSDRLVVEWRLQSVPRSGAGRGAGGRTLLAQTNNLPSLHTENGLEEQTLRIEVPGNVQRMKRETPEIAREWRLALRTAMTWALDRGYIVRDFVDGAFLLERGKETDYEH